MEKVKPKDSSVKKKPMKRKQKTKGCAVSKEYSWKVLSAIVSDAENSPYSEALAEQIKQLRGIIRRRSVSDYLDFCDRLSLATVNRDERLLDQYQRDQEVTTAVIRFRRIFTTFQKFDFPDSPFDRQAAAFEAFVNAEKSCQKVNQDPLFVNEEFLNLEDDGSLPTIDCVFLHPVLRAAKRFISAVVGDHCVHSVIFAESCHGPGATFDKRGEMSLPVRKYVPPFGVTSGASGLFLQYLFGEDRWMRSLIDEYRFIKEKEDDHPTVVFEWLRDFTHRLVKPVEGSRVMFVPKDTRKFRTICAEPTANVFLQLGVDRFLRKRLRRFGIDLSTQAKNQYLAAQGAVSNKLTTLDLKAASDTVALGLLKLFPPEWRSLLTSLRSPKGRLEGEEFTFEKLSSMGNGFTFCIETLVFAALLFGVMKVRGESWKARIDDIAVYGDDIICPTEYTNDYVYVLKRCGFAVNSAKSFSSGPVRESCGCDYFLHHEISRPTIKETPTRNWELTRDHNRFYRLSQQYGLKLGRTLQLILSWHTEQFFGPMCEDECGWLFREHPDVAPNHTCKDAVNWQIPVFRLKRTVVSHPIATADRRDVLFSPLLYLRRVGNAYESVLSRLFSANDPIEIRDEALAFLKMRTQVRITVISLPFYEWQKDPTYSYELKD